MLACDRPRQLARAIIRQRPTGVERFVWRPSNLESESTTAHSCDLPVRGAHANHLATDQKYPARDNARGHFQPKLLTPTSRLEPFRFADKSALCVQFDRRSSQRVDYSFEERRDTNQVYQTSRLVSPLLVVDHATVD